MIPKFQSLRMAVLTASMAAISIAPSMARADLPPPQGTKRVGFDFSVDNVTAFPGYALFAFPCGISSGAPMEELAEINGASVNVGRRGGDCEIYVAPRAAYDAWRKTYKPTPGQMQDKAAEDFVKNAKVRKCEGAPKLEFSLPSTDSRDAIHDVLHIAALDEKKCTLVDVTPASAPATPPVPSAAVPSSAPSSATSAAPAASGGPDTSASATPTDPPPATHGSGCGGCTVGSNESVATFASIVVAAVGVSLLRTRRSKSGRRGSSKPHS